MAMNEKEIEAAREILAPYTDRTDTIIEGDGQNITAYWTDGGQSMFCSLAQVEAHCDYGDLCNYCTGETIRKATADERRRSIEAAWSDGGAGVIDVNGTNCYVRD